MSTEDASTFAKKNYCTEKGRKWQNLKNLFEDKIKYLTLFTILFVIEALLSLRTGHPFDMDVWFNTGEWLNQGINIYMPLNHIGYPPLWALWCGVANFFYYLSGNNLEFWRFIIKFPIIIGHLALAYIVGKFAESRFALKTAKKIFLIVLTWSFFIYSGAIWGQINVLSAFLTFSAFYALTEKRTTLSAFLLGSAITLKIYPIIALPAFLVYILKNQGKKISGKFILIACAVPVLFTLTIFAIYQWDIVYFLRTIFYSTPIFEADPLQFNVGCMNIWSFIALLGVDIVPLWYLRQLWIPILATGAIYWLKKPKMDEKNLTLSLVFFYILFIVSYGWISEQTIVDLLPFAFLMVIAYNQKRNYMYILLLIQTFVFIFSFANQSLAVFAPLVQALSPRTITDAQNFLSDNGPLIWFIRGSFGLVVSISLILFLIILIKPEILKQAEERLQSLYKSIRRNMN